MNASSDRPGFPREGRLLGIDFGTKRIGFAVSTPDQTIASPLENYTRCGSEQDAWNVNRLVRDYQVAGLVVGLPVHMSGDEGQKAREARRFGRWASEQTGLPVCFWDERYTSAIAEEHLMAANLSKKKRRSRMDKVAAQIMLQSFLDTPDRNRTLDRNRTPNRGRTPDAW